MDRILDAIFDLFRWPIITVYSLYRYKLRADFHKTPDDLRTLRVFLKNAAGWAAIILAISAIQKREYGLVPQIFEVKSVVYSSSFLEALFGPVLFVPMIAAAWIVLGWGQLRNRILAFAAVRDAFLLCWSGFSACVVLFLLLSHIPNFPGVVENASTPLLFISAYLVNLRALSVVHRKYARATPTKRRLLLVAVLSLVSGILLRELFSVLLYYTEQAMGRNIE